MNLYMIKTYNLFGLMLNNIKEKWKSNISLIVCLILSGFFRVEFTSTTTFS